MASVKLYSKDGAERGSVDVSDAVFGVEPNSKLIHDVAVALQNAKRQGNAQTKTRAAVSGGGRKPFRQKGTGNARQGSSREPQMRGGGTVFGPQKRSYRQAVPTQSRRKALCCALSDRVRTNSLCVIEALECAEPKTKPFAELMGKVAPEGRKTLLVAADQDPNVALSVRNIPRVQIITAADLNALDVLNAVQVVVAQGALPKLEERLA